MGKKKRGYGLSCIITIIYEPYIILYTETRNERHVCRLLLSKCVRAFEITVCGYLPLSQ